MALFSEVFNPASIYEMLFFNVKSVLIYPTLFELKEKNPVLFERWKDISKEKIFDSDIVEPKLIANTDADMRQIVVQDIYEEQAVRHPEFCRIVAITYATLYSENGEIKRYFKKIVNDDEYIVIATFMDVLHQVSSDGTKSTPQYFPTLCGHNIISYDIPLLMRRFVYHRNNFSNKHVPYILKRTFDMKPWESGLIDVVNVWKFNGFDYTPLMLIADFLGLKKTVNLLSQKELSKYYWNNIESKPGETLNDVALQSATQTNLVIQLMMELRQL